MTECRIPVPGPSKDQSPDHRLALGDPLILPVARPRDPLRDIERPHDLEALEHGEKLVV